MRALLFDLDGVLYQSDRVIDGAVETLRWFEQRGIPYLFVTNTSSKPRSALVDRLSSMGLSVSAEQIFTPPVAAYDYLTANDAMPLALFVTPSKAPEASSSATSVRLGTSARSIARSAC
jgi:HAD superfamily hydrolase (TIGR01450 family)